VSRKVAKAQKNAKKAMKILQFTFKNEAKWILVFSLAPVAVAVFFMIAIWLLRAMR